MSTQASFDFTERVIKLEREVRTWRRLALPILLVVVAVALVGAKTTTVPDEIRAKKFILVDSFGTVLAELGWSLGTTHLALYDYRGGKGVELRAFPGIAEVQLLHEGVSRVWLSAMKDESGVLVSDQAGHHSGKLSEYEMSIGEGEKAATLAIRANGSLALDFVDGAKRRRAAFGIEAQGRPLLGLYDESGKVVFHVCGSNTTCCRTNHGTDFDNETESFRSAPSVSTSYDCVLT